MAALTLQGYHGSLTDLATHLRRRRIDALSISATEMVRQLRLAWSVMDVPTFDQVAEDLPVAAWVVRRKGQSLIPGSLPDEPEEVVPPPPWPSLPQLAAWLRERHGAQDTWHGPERWPDPPPRDIPDATPWRLRWAWPPGRAPVRPEEPAVVVRSEPLWRRGLLVAHWLGRQRGEGDFQDLARSLSRREQVEVFLVLLTLWARHRVSMDQSAAYGPLRIRLARRLPVRAEEPS